MGFGWRYVDIQIVCLREMITKVSMASGEAEHAEAADVGDDVDVAQSAIIHPPMPRGPAMLK